MEESCECLLLDGMLAGHSLCMLYNILHLGPAHLHGALIYFPESWCCYSAPLWCCVVCTLQVVAQLLVVWGTAGLVLVFKCCLHSQMAFPLQSCCLIKSIQIATPMLLNRLCLP